MATVIASEVGRRVGQAFLSVNDAARSEGFLSLSLAEINSCGALHQFWSDHPRLSYSEFGSTTPDVANQDLMALTYADETFDFVFTSETLEHVPDVSRALAEIRRVLIPGGAHIFTVPVVDDRPTRQRAVVIDNAVHHLLEPSFHGRIGTSSPDRLVFYEFGNDTTWLIQSCGFTVRHVQDPRNPALQTFVALKTNAPTPGDA